jgi:hypothetical protein
MRGAILIAAVALASIMAVSATATGQAVYSYPWCGRTTKTDSNVTWCYFMSHEQCKATVSGIGAMRESG